MLSETVTGTKTARFVPHVIKAEKTNARRPLAKIPITAGMRAAIGSQARHRSWRPRDPGSHKRLSHIPIANDSRRIVGPFTRSQSPWSVPVGPGDMPSPRLAGGRPTTEARPRGGG